MTMHKVNLPPAPQSPRSVIAAWLAAQGFYVFRLGANSKRPIAEGWQDEATNDPIEARLLFVGKNAQCNIGIRCLHHIVVDLDVKDGHDGPGDWVKLLDEYADTISASTMKASTPSGGAHYFFRLPPDTPEVRNTRGSLADGIDTRGAGGYVVAHGSSIDGRYYAIEGDRILTAPQWLIALNGAGRVKRHGADEIEGAVDDPRMIEAAIEMLQGHQTVIAGGRNQAVFVVAKRLRDRGLARDTARSLIFEHFADTKLAPPLDYEEVEATIKSAYDHNTTAGGAMNSTAAFEPVEALVDMAGLPIGLEPVSGLVYAGPPRYVVKGLITAGTVGMITGTSEAGKSPLMMDIASHVALGETWNGHRTKRSYVLHISTEGGAGLAGRFEAQKRRMAALGHSIADGVPFDRIETRSIPNATLVDDAQGTGLDRQFVNAVIKMVQARAEHYGVEPGLIVLDTFSPLLGGKSDSDDGACREALTNIRRIVAKTGAAVMFVHHPTKAPAGQGGSTFRGSSVLQNDTDLQLWAERDAQGLGELTTPRIKDWAQMRPLGYSLEVHELMEDEDGDMSTSIAVRFDVNHGSVNASAAEEFDGKEVRRVGGDQLAGPKAKILLGVCRAAHQDQGINPEKLAFDTAAMKLFNGGTSNVSNYLGDLVASGFLVARHGTKNAKSYSITKQGLQACEKLSPGITNSSFRPAESE